MEGVNYGETSCQGRARILAIVVMDIGPALCDDARAISLTGTARPPATESNLRSGEPWLNRNQLKYHPVTPVLIPARLQVDSERFAARATHFASRLSQRIAASNPCRM